MAINHHEPKNWNRIADGGEVGRLCLDLLRQRDELLEKLDHLNVLISDFDRVLGLEATNV